MPKYNESRQVPQIGIQKYLDPSGGWNWIQVGNRGRIEYTSVKLEDDFLGDQIQDEWTQAGDGGATFAIVAGIGGLVTGTCAAVDNDKVELVGNLNWAANRAAIFETRLTIGAAVTTVCVMAGLTDAVAEGANTMPYANAGGRARIADDCVLIGYDTDDAALFPGWTGLSAIAAAANAQVDLVDVPVAGTYQVLRIELDTLGNADYFINGVYRGSSALAITVTDPLTPYVGVMNRAGGAIQRTVSVDYVHVYQRRLV